MIVEGNLMAKYGILFKNSEKQWYAWVDSQTLKPTEFDEEQAKLTYADQCVKMGPDNVAMFKHISAEIITTVNLSEG